MPTYEYRCSNCEHEMEAFQSIKAKSLKKCPECGEKTLQRLIGTGVGVIFKGSGFWETDYKKKTGSAESADSSANGSGSDAGQKTNGDSPGSSSATKSESSSSSSGGDSKKADGGSSNASGSSSNTGSSSKNKPDN